MENNETPNPTEDVRPKVDTASIYPEPKNTRPIQEEVQTQQTQAPQAPVTKNKKVFIPVNTIIAVVVSLGIGIVLGMTVFKPAPSPEEAAKVLFDGAFSELSNELNGFDFSDFDFEEN